MILGGLLWMCAWSLFAMFVVLIFFPSVILYFLVSCVSSLVYGVYLIYDT
jgi:FtsH-binding integral membrane protein